MTEGKQTTLLLILDGWGHRESTEHNAIAAARTPIWDKLISDCPSTLIHTSGLKVGLPDGQMGNSEVGHMNLGAGRVVYQSLTRIDKAIEDGEFQQNPVINKAIDTVVNNNKSLHIMGLLSPGGIHSHLDQISALVEMAAKKGCQKVYLHALLDGRDTPPRSALPFVEKLEDLFSNLGCGQIASVCGRFFGMDRDKRWDRVSKAFNAICHGEADYYYSSATDSVNAAYERDENDEFVIPSCILNKDSSPITIENDDAVIFMNFRADRARELSQVFVDQDFSDFDRGDMPALSHFVSLTEYSKDLDTEVAFPPEELSNVLGEYLSNQNKTQLRIAETEKYAHVTFFFSGGREEEFTGEKRILIPSPQVATYDLKPDMSAPEVTEKLVEAIKSGEYDTIICNYANGDMVGHTGVWDAAIQAAEVVDDCLEKITTAIREVQGHCLITADHGNLEQMLDEKTGQPMTAHTNGPVPLIYVGNDNVQLKDDGALSDVAPTMLALMGIEQPPEMTGHSLIKTD